MTTFDYRKLLIRYMDGIGRSDSDPIAYSDAEYRELCRLVGEPVPDTSEIPEPAPAEQDWFFTFGADHLDGRGRNRYVIVHGTCESARTKMVEKYGNRWAFQYFRAETVPVPPGEEHHTYLYRGAGVKKYGLIQIDFETGEDIVA